MWSFINRGVISAGFVSGLPAGQNSAVESFLVSLVCWRQGGCCPTACPSVLLPLVHPLHFGWRKEMFAGQSGSDLLFHIRDSTGASPVGDAADTQGSLGFYCWTRLVGRWACPLVKPLGIMAEANCTCTQRDTCMCVHMLHALAQGWSPSHQGCWVVVPPGLFTCLQ